MQTAVSLYDYQAVEENEIDLLENEIITKVICLDDGWWRGKNTRGQEGFFPGNYVQLKTNSEPNEKKKSAIALYDYEAVEENELQLNQGQIISDIVFISDEWWQGTLNGKVGLCK